MDCLRTPSSLHRGTDTEIYRQGCSDSSVAYFQVVWLSRGIERNLPIMISKSGRRSIHSKYISRQYWVQSEIVAHKATDQERTYGYVVVP